MAVAIPPIDAQPACKGAKVVGANIVGYLSSEDPPQRNDNRRVGAQDYGSDSFRVALLDNSTNRRRYSAVQVRDRLSLSGRRDERLVCLIVGLEEAFQHRRLGRGRLVKVSLAEELCETAFGPDCHRCCELGYVVGSR